MRMITFIIFDDYSALQIKTDGQ